MRQTLQLKTTEREQLVDITRQVTQAIQDAKVTSGLACIYCPHTTAGITIQESADPDVARDLITTLSRLVPHRGDYRHAEGNADAHVKSALVGSSQTVPIEDGRPRLGRWQGIFFCEFDGPRTRTVWIELS